MKFSVAFALVTSLAVSTSAYADGFVVQPVQTGYENVRYQQGSPTIDLKMAHGAVEIRPLPLDHGSLAFSVAILNANNTPITVDTGNFYIKAGNQVLSPFTVDQLQSKAKSRAAWSKFGVSMVGVLASSMAASQTNTYYSSFSTPYGRYTSRFSAPSLAGQIQSDRIMDNTVAGVAAIQGQLDATRARLGDEIVQTSTIDPGQIYAGKLVFQKLKDNSLPQRITLIAGLNGEQYAFTFQLAKPGTPAPAITNTVQPAPVNYVPGALPAQPAAPPATQPAFIPAAAQVYPQPVSSTLSPASALGGGFATGRAQSVWRASEPSAPNIAQIIQRTAELMPHPVSLTDGSVVTSFVASGDRLLVTARLPSGSHSMDDTARASLGRAICTNRALYPIIGQGGTINAQYAGSGDKPAAVLTLNRQECGL